MASDTGNPTETVPSDRVREAVLGCYCQLQHAERTVVEGGFHGGIPFDSILGVEMAANLEITLGVTIPEERLMRTSVYASLAAFAIAIQGCVDAVEENPA